MIEDKSQTRMPAPCIVDRGILVNKRDILCLLRDVGRVRYLYWQDGELMSDDEGYLMEVFADHERSTTIANHAIYLNVYSFDCLELKRPSKTESCFDLVQEGRKLRLIPLSNPLQQQPAPNLDPVAIEAAIAEVLSAKFDAEIDLDDGTMPC